MVEVKKVKTKKEQREFLNFPLKLYKGCPYYSPPLYMDEKNLFNPNYSYYKTCEAIYFNAYIDGKMVGRIGGILQKSANEKWNQKRVRFTRFDLINDLEVAKALIKSVEDWARSKGMEEVFGPMGFSDMEREGMLVDGFDELTTFNENYNYDYYKDLLEQLGYVKEVDWVCHKVSDNLDFDISKAERIVDKAMEKYNFRICDEKKTNDILKKYGRSFFDIVEESYNDLYQTVPFTEEQINDMIKSFRLILSKQYIELMVDENDEVVAFGLTFPMISDILVKTGGKLYPHILPQLLYRLKHSKVVEFGLIGVRKKYLKTGVSFFPLIIAAKALRSGRVKYFETNLNLEDNLNIINMFHHFTVVRHRRVRTYIKNIK